MKSIHDMDTDKVPAIQNQPIYTVPTVKVPTVPIPRQELLRRIEAIHAKLYNERLYPSDRFNRPIKLQAVNALRQAIMQLGNAYGDNELTYRLNNLLALTVDITGV